MTLHHRRCIHNSYLSKFIKLATSPIQSILQSCFAFPTPGPGKLNLMPLQLEALACTRTFTLVKELYSLK